MSLIKFLFRPFFHFFSLYLTNYVISYIPIRILRKTWLKLFLRMKIGKKTFIDMGSYYMSPWNIEVGNYTHINRGCFIDGRGGIKIGNNVSLSHKVSLVTGSHDINSIDNKYVKKEILIDDYVFVGINATILQGVHIGKGAVVCAGACVTKNLEPYGIYGGVPAKKIGERIRDLDYKCDPKTFFC